MCPILDMKKKIYIYKVVPASNLHSLIRPNHAY